MTNTLALCFVLCPLLRMEATVAAWDLFCEHVHHRSPSLSTFLPYRLFMAPHDYMKSLCSKLLNRLLLSQCSLKHNLKHFIDLAATESKFAPN